MTTPQGGSPDEKPDATGGRTPDPDPDVTSFSAPPQDPPPSWPAADPPPAAAPVPPPAPSRGWSEDAPPADAPPAAWTPPATPPADETRAGWPAPPPDPRAGFAGGPSAWGPPAAEPPSWSAPDGGAGWAAPGTAPPGPPSSWAPGVEPTWAPGQPGDWAPPAQPGWAAPQQPGWAPQQPGWAQQQPGWDPPQPGWAQQQQPGWSPPQPGWAAPSSGWAPPGTQPTPGPQPTQIGPTWGQPAWGAPHPGWAPPPPPPRRGRLVALIAVGVLLLAALGVGGYLLVRDTAAGPAAVPADFRPITTSTLTYAVPPNWADSPNSLSVLGASFEGRADAPGYTCADARYFRGLAASAFVPGERPAAAVAAAFARETGRVFYVSADGGIPDVEVSAARPVDVGGVEGQVVEATSRTATDDGCLATSGTVLLLAVPTPGPDGAPGTAVLVVNGDTAGGPATAPPLADRATLDAVLNSARLPSI